VKRNQVMVSLITSLPIKFMHNGVIATLFLCFFIFPSYGGEIDYTAVKESVISHCQQEPNDNLKMSCLVLSANYLNVFEKAYENKERSLLTICANLTLSLKSNSTRLFHLVRCVAEQYNLEENHPHPKYSRLMLRKDELRANWVSMCPDKNNISKCLKGHELALSSFWQFYISSQSKSPGDEVFRKMDRCLNQRDIRLTNFTEANSCLGY
jgi:hypothetical protein